MSDTNQSATQHRHASVDQLSESIVSDREGQIRFNNLLKTHLSLLLLYAVLTFTGVYFVSAVRLLLVYS